MEGNMSEYWEKAQARLSRRRLLSGVSAAAVGGVALAAVGCGDDDAGSTATATATPTIASGNAPAQSASASASATKAVKEGANVRVALGAEPTVVDPHQSTGGVDNFYLFQIFNQLYEWDSKGAAVPALAES
jgi:ABC-type transport system substrate-binding protein